MLHLHVAERADALVAALPPVLVTAESDPFAPAIVSVPTRGIERWLAQRLSHHLGVPEGRGDGVSANIEFPYPGNLLATAVEEALGLDSSEDAWGQSRLLWPLLEVVDRSLGEPWLAALATYLGGSEGEDELRRSRRGGTVRHIADLFSRYAVSRPAMLRAWADGAEEDGSGTPLREEAVWQARLWQALHTRIGTPSPPERVADACERLREDPALSDLPPSLSIFGITRIPVSQLEVLEALSVHREIHLWLLHPSPALWRGLPPQASEGQDPRRSRDDTVEVVGHPILASWGHDARELQLVLGRADAEEHHHEIERDGEALLTRIQRDISLNAVPPGPPSAGAEDPRPPLDSADSSIRVHACHGRARQVEVLRDAVMCLLAEDPTLEPRDIIVMCPDVEDFAPLIHAVFGSAAVALDEDDPTDLPAIERPPDLRVRIADRGARRTNDLLAGLSDLLALAPDRLTASQLLDFANLEPVRRRFRFSDDDLSRVLEWINESCIHWGIDVDHRAPYEVKIDDGTWRRGLDRILLGAAMTEDEQRTFAGVLPVDDVEGGAMGLAGRFAELIDRLKDAFDSFDEAQPIGGWRAALTRAADALMLPARGAEWERLELDRVLDRLAEGGAAGGEGDLPTLDLSELRALIQPMLEGQPTRANFRTGHLTVCTLMPMRSVPHRVVCLLGLDDGAFPRKSPRDGDDLMLAEPHLADRDPRLEDRQLLLDALMAAREHLVITYKGNDERTNEEVPPAVPVAELLDVVDATVAHPEAGKRTSDAVHVKHPLQAFDPRNFAGGASTGSSPRSFDQVNLAGAEALISDPQEPAPFLDGPLEPMETGAIELDQLLGFTAHPVRAFLKQRLGVDVRDFFEDVDDSLPLQLDALSRWGIGNRLLLARRSGIDPGLARRAELARGSLPPGELATPVLEEVDELVERLTALANERLPGGGRDSEDVSIELSDGRLISGTVGWFAGDTLQQLSYSRLKARERLAAWVKLLALSAARPETAWSAVTVAKAPRGDGCAVSTLSNETADPTARREWAQGHLDAIVDLFDRGMREPLPLYCSTSCAYAESVAAGDDEPFEKAREVWDGPWTFPGEREDAEHRLVFGGVVDLDEVLEKEPSSGESGAGWATEEATRLGRVARRLWDELLEHEEVEVLKP